jgi:hypothetical protein
LSQFENRKLLENVTESGQGFYNKWMTDPSTFIAGWSMPALSEPGIVALTTAALVAWNTWKQNRQGKQLTAVHILTNSAMGAQLKINVDFANQNAVLLHRLADISKEAGDLAAATAADVIVETQKALYQEHLLKQAKVDATQ